MLQLEMLKDHCNNRHFYLHTAFLCLRRHSFSDMAHYSLLAEREQQLIDKLETAYPGAFF